MHEVVGISCKLVAVVISGNSCRSKELSSSNTNDLMGKPPRTAIHTLCIAKQLPSLRTTDTIAYGTVSMLS